MFLFSPPKLEAEARSEIGPRDENQDNYLIINGRGEAEYLSKGRPYRQKLEQWPKGFQRLCVIDGMGGHNHGQAFATAVAEALLSESPKPTSLRKRRAQLLALHDQLRQHWHQGPESPGSTLIWADIHPNGVLYLAHVGDSRAFLQHKGEWQQLTCDHSPSGYFQRDTKTDEEWNFPETHEVVQALGFGSFGIIKGSDGASPLLRLDLAEDLAKPHRKCADLKRIKLKKGDQLMLASDGLWSGESKSPWSEFPSDKPLKESLRDMLWNLLETGCSDNVTAVVCRIK